MLTELDVVNDMLATMAEAPVTTLNIKHPLIAAGLQKLARASQSMQAQRWWFNCITIDVTPADGTYLVEDQLPCGTIMVWSRNANCPVTLRDGQLLEVNTSEVVTTETRIVVHFEVPFRDLPVSANLAVAAKALLDFQVLYDGDGARTTLLKDDAKEKKALMTAEHMRVNKVNLLDRPGTLHSRERVRGRRAFVVN